MEVSSKAADLDINSSQISIEVIKLIVLFSENFLQLPQSYAQTPNHYYR